MVNSNVIQTFASIHLNRQTLQPVYESDSTIAMNTDFFLNPTDAKTMEQLKWDDIITSTNMMTILVRREPHLLTV